MEKNTEFVGAGWSNNLPTCCVVLSFYLHSIWTKAAQAPIEQKKPKYEVGGKRFVLFFFKFNLWEPDAVVSGGPERVSASSTGSTWPLYLLNTHQSSGLVTSRRLLLSRLSRYTTGVSSRQSVIITRRHKDVHATTRGGARNSSHYQTHLGEYVGGRFMFIVNMKAAKTI